MNCVGGRIFYEVHLEVTKFTRKNYQETLLGYNVKWKRISKCVVLFSSMHVYHHYQFLVCVQYEITDDSISNDIT